MYCGVDLAVKRRSTVAFFDGKGSGYLIEIGNADLPDVVKVCKVIAVDSPLTPGKGYRDFERCMLRMGLKVFPTSFLKDLYKTAVELFRGGNAIETHPRSSFKLSRVEILNAGSKDEEDAIIASLVAFLHTRGLDYEIVGSDGVIHLANGLRAVINVGHETFSVLALSSSRACRSLCTLSK